MFIHLFLFLAANAAFGYDDVIMNIITFLYCTLYKGQLEKNLSSGFSQTSHSSLLHIPYQCSIIFTVKIDSSNVWFRAWLQVSATVVPGSSGTLVVSSLASLHNASSPTRQYCSVAKSSFLNGYTCRSCFLL